MIAAIPFFEMRMVEEGVRVILGGSSFVVPTLGIPIDPWATLVCLGVLLGLEMSRARAIKMGIEPRDIVDGVVATVGIGFIGAHVITVIGYHPERLQEEGIWSLLKIWEGFSSTGGFLGAFLGILLFYRWLRPRDVWRFADLIAYGFPLGWILGRLGCSVVHDHIGQPTDFFLGMYFPPGHYAATATEGVVRHELGLYEFLLTLPLMALFVWLGRKDQPPGTFFGLFFVFYAPVRFGLDYLRNTDLAYADARWWGGLTAAQYGMVALFFLGVWMVWEARRRPFAPFALDGQPHQDLRAAAAAGVPAMGLGGEVVTPEAAREALEAAPEPADG